MRLWFLLAAFAFMLVGLGASSGGDKEPAQEQPISPAGFAQIAIGMTESEVSKALGGPPGHYNDSDVIPCSEDRSVCELIGKGNWKEWRGNRWWIGISFDENGHVRGKTINYCVPAPQTLWENVALWFYSR
jgi:hypothetical protein